MVHQQRVLIAPLDWGMGHATRCIPLIKSYQEIGYHVIVAAPSHLLNRLMPALSKVDAVTLAGYNIHYHKNLPVWLSVLVQLPKIRKAIRNEHQWLLKQVKELNLHLVVSDNRYGLWHPSIRSVMISHQLQPKPPFGARFCAPIIQRVMRQLLKNFDEIHVPDFEGPQRLSGALSEPFDGLPQITYIGPLSRFTRASTLEIVPHSMLALLSGPEPHYSTFYHTMRLNAHKEGLSFRALGWKMPKNANEADMLLNPDDEQFAAEVAKSATIVCAAGYSTLCDLLVLKRKASLFPTLGQTEQEYLAKRFNKLGQNEA